MTIEGPIFDEFQNLELVFQYHMYADPSAQLSRELKEKNRSPVGALEFLVKQVGDENWLVWWSHRGGRNDDGWHEVIVDLSAYLGGPIQIGFRATTPTHLSDIAIDRIIAREKTDTGDSARGAQDPAIRPSLIERVTPNDRD